jgi:hypothetical protein
LFSFLVVMNSPCWTAAIVRDNVRAMTKPRKIFYGSTAGLLGISLSFIVAEHIRGAVMLRQHLAALRNKGETLATKDLKPEAVDEDDNAALFFVNDLLDPELPGVIESWAPPVRPMIAPGRAVVGAQLARWDAASNNDSGAEGGLRKDWSGLRTALGPHRENIEDLRRYIARPGFNTGADFDSGFSNWSTPPLLPVKRGVSILRATAMLALRDGDWDSAVADLRTMIRLCDHLDQEPLLITQLVRWACVAIALDLTWEAIQAEGISDIHLAAIQDAWARGARC